MARPSPEFAGHDFSARPTHRHRSEEDAPSPRLPLAIGETAKVRALRRDLEWLLNTRKLPFLRTKGSKEVQLLGVHVRAARFHRLQDVFPWPNIRSCCGSSRTSVKLFAKPRLANIKVVPIETGDTLSRTLRLRIEGLLLIDPAPEHVAFDTVLQLTSGQRPGAKCG